MRVMSADLLSIPEAVLLGIVEGITEFLPVSSTGHLLIVGEWIGFGTGEAAAASDTYSIAIQFGAILAVLFLYRIRIGSMLRGVVGNDSEGRTVLLRLVTAFAPAALLGFFFGDAIKDVLFGPVPVTIAWAVGGVVLLLWKPPTGALHLHQLTTRSAVVIGIAQGVALWPGVSRSLVTLIAALAIGLTLSAALEFSFLLGLVTLSAASLYDFARNGSELVDQFGVAAPLVGLVTAFVTALLAVRWMVGYLSTHSLAIFGWYRLMIAGGCAVLLLTGVL
jgi:undecaprenyl-diphosphatase